MLNDLINSKKVIIFDFDGVIADSVDIKTRAFGSLFKKFGKIIQKKVTSHHLENGGMSRYDKIEFYFKEYVGKEINQFELKSLCSEFSSLVVDQVVNSKEINGATELLSELYKKNKLMFINTGTPTDEIKKILVKRKISKYFKNIYGSPNTKKENIECILNTYSINSNNCVFFGDALSDLNAASYYNIEFIGVGEFIKNHLKKTPYLHIKDFMDFNK